MLPRSYPERGYSMKFTDRAIQSIKPEGERFEVWEDNGKGLGLRVSSVGRKSWVFLYRFEGKPRRLTLGHYPAMSLADAHAAHAKARQMLERGTDPGALEVSARERARKAPTVADLAGEFMEKWSKPRKRSWKEDERLLNKEVLPYWGGCKAADITRRDVLTLLEGVVERGSPIQANRLFAVIRKIFNFGVERDIVPHTPCSHVRAPANPNRRDRVLTPEEIRAFWEGLDKADEMGDGIKRALKLVLVTAQRPGEVLGASWKEIEGEWWTIPGEKAKNGIPHRVPLSSLALELMGPRGEGLLFPSPRRDTEVPVQVNALSHGIRRNRQAVNVEDFTPHDLRRTAASHMTGAGIPRLTVSKILNHAEQGVTAVYDRHSYDQEKRQALEKWSRTLKGVLGKAGDKVLRMR